MDLLFWMTVGVIIFGFVVLASMKKSMESKLAFIIRNMDSEKSSSKSIVWWIVGTGAWAIVSMYLLVWWFSIK